MNITKLTKRELWQAWQVATDQQTRTIIENELRSRA